VLLSSVSVIEKSDVNEDCIDKRFERSCKDTRYKTTEEESENVFSLGV
jgi:hypothetical protein